MKKGLKILALVLAVCFMVSLVSACGAQKTEDPKAQAPAVEEKKEEPKKEEPKAEAKKKKIGVIYLTAEHPYYQAHAKHTQEYCKEKGLDLVELDGKIDQANMSNQMENLIAQKVDGIIYCLLEGKAASADINAAQKAGIPVITFAIPHDKATANAPFVGINEKAAGAMGGEAAGKYFQKNFAGKKAKIAVVELVGTAASTDRSDGFIEGFKKVIADAEVVARLNGEGKRDKSMAVTEDFLRAHPDTNVFFGANGDQGLGALAALESSGRGTTKTEIVVSHDGSEPELLKVADPNSALKIANANQPRDLARGTVDTLLEILDGKRKMTDTADVMIPSTVVTGDDLDAAQKFLKEQFLSNTALKK